MWWDTRLMRSQKHHFASRILRCVTVALVAAFSTPAFAQSDIQAVVLKHLKTSREFTLKVADQMPESVSQSGGVESPGAPVTP